MAKSKGSRVGINLKCTSCESQTSRLINHNYDSVSRTKKTNIIYRTTKNRKNNPNRLELKKFCRICNKHSLYKETK